VVHPGNGNPDNTLVNALLFHVPALSKGFEVERPGIVHRLDKDTSGVLLVAKTDTAHAALAKMFYERSMEKNYVGLCVGMRPQEHAIIDKPLGRNTREPLKRAVHTEGKNALTEYWLLHHHSGMSLVQFRLHTGRTHQIRVHCCSVGFPILCDELYGGGKDRINTLAVLERPFAHKLYKCFNRQALHAHRISFTHPFTKEAMSIVAPYPEDFKAAFKVLGVEEPSA
jgi:23S rRNA pseudouridine1911/1915/1917 synthase